MHLYLRMLNFWQKNTDTLVGIGLVILLATEEQELSYSISSTSMLVLLRLRLSWVLLVSCIDLQVVVSQNSGVKKPPAVSCIFSTGHVEVSRRSVLPAVADAYSFTITCRLSSSCCGRRSYVVVTLFRKRIISEPYSAVPFCINQFPAEWKRPA